VDGAERQWESNRWTAPTGSPSEFAQAQEGETVTMSCLLTVHRRVTGEPESEPVVVDTDDPRVAVLEPDDGGRLELDPRAPRSAIEGDSLPRVR